MNEFTDNKRLTFATAIALVTIVIAAAYLRFAQLGVPSFWVDELNFVYAGKSIVAGEEPRFPSGNLNQRARLYAESVALSFRLFGVNEFGARFPSAVFGVLSVVAVFFIARDLFGRNAGLLSAFLLTFSHLCIGWSRLARMYTLFQLLYIIGAYAFYKGFEGATRSLHSSKRSRFDNVRAYFALEGIRWPWLIASATVLAVSFHVHELTGIIVASVLVFIAGMTGVLLFTKSARATLVSKYGLALGIAFAGAIIGVLLFDAIGFVQHAVSFQPSWANYAYVQDSHYYYYLLTESSQFPLAAFFLLGCVHMLTRGNKAAFFVCCNFAMPVFLHSFVFAYKIPNYIFQVYPFFVMLAAYALHNLYQDEKQHAQSVWQSLKKLFTPRVKRYLLVGMIFGWLPLTIWFRYALKLPFMGTAGNNGAVDYDDWREAANYVQAHATSEQVLVSTLPLTLHHYLGKVDYNLNNANTDSTLDWQPGVLNGKPRDYYSGAEAITNFDELQHMLAQHGEALFVVDTYRFERSQYVPTEVAQFVKNNMTRVWEDEKKTMQVFRRERK
ncbi:glycosyltransferase family 39 protein [candidate division KSB1 bacterium]|nr:glycosyltransferase family 39 protein [candidate division KSB1 bacterium]